MVMVTSAWWVLFLSSPGDTPGDAVAEWSRCRIVAGLVTSSSPIPLKTRHQHELLETNVVSESLVTLGLEFTIELKRHWSRARAVGPGFSRRRGLGHEDNTENLNGVFLERGKKGKRKKKRVVKPPKVFIHDSPVDCKGDTGVFLCIHFQLRFRVFDGYVKILAFECLVGFGSGTGIQDFVNSVKLMF
ncbi:hypothetical protein TNCV_4191521 [Trichonephila clavipes]|nr:hypothetical protein TNCV_4191521 [Trichonephila clavipes]